MLTLFRRSHQERYARGKGPLRSARVQSMGAERMRWLWFAACAVALAPALVFAQAVEPSVPIIGFTGAMFFASVIAGLVLAFAFQMILTNLSVAAGLNVIGGAMHRSGGETRGRSGGGSPGVQAGIRKISGAFGMWALVTASLSLFFASWLAVELSLTTSAALGAIVGLVIWGLFYIAMMAVEASAVSSLVGSLARTASSGLRSAYRATSSLFAKSPEDRLASAASKITESVRQELFGDTGDFQAQLQQFVNQLKPAQFSPEQIGRGIADVLDDSEIRIVESEEGRASVVSFIEKHGKVSKEQAQAIAGNIKGKAQAVKEEAGAQKDMPSKVADAAMKMAGVPGGEARAYREKVENYLRSTGKSELNPDGIKRDIERLLSDPKGGFEALKSRASQIDKSSLVALLSQRKDMSKEEAQRVVDRVDQVLGEISRKVLGTAGGAQGKAQGMAANTEDKIRNYLDSLNRPELRYEGIKSDLVKLFNDPKAGMDSLLQRLKSVDRNTLKALLSSRRDISEQDAERIINRIESVRDEYIGKAERLRDEAGHKLEQARQEAIHQSDETRKTAATASWWMFGTAVISAIAAVLGGMTGA